LSQPRSVLVSAGASGIGRKIAEAFDALGDRVHVFDISAERLDALRDARPGMSCYCADASNDADLAVVFDSLARSGGRLDVLVNNVGIPGPTAPVDDVEPAEWDRTIAVDLSANFYCTRRAVPLMKAAGGGSIINIASTAGLYACPLRSPYVAAKWAMVGLTRTWAMELGAHGIRVNALCPGSVSGPRIDGVIERDAERRGMSPAQIREVYLQQTSLGVFVDAEDVAQMAVFLASDAGRYVSGQAIAIDGNTESLANWLDRTPPGERR